MIWRKCILYKQYYIYYIYSHWIPIIDVSSNIDRFCYSCVYNWDLYIHALAAQTDLLQNISIY